MAQGEWEWATVDCQKSHGERAALLRPITYEVTPSAEKIAGGEAAGRALSLNVSSGGMLILMSHAPSVEQVIKVYVPTPLSGAEIPTLAEVRWTRQMPFGGDEKGRAYFVGLKFIF